ncbi:MAG TPA: ComEC/Rec2 family competence protein [Clostridiales bacterium]|nr:ComEC/Rec2 family competence protein [Clostridiales bacterium]
MNRPLFYIGSAYLWTLLLLSLTGKVFAVGLLLFAASCGILELVFFFRKKKVGIVPAVCLSCALACTAFLLKTQYALEPALALAGSKQKVEGTVREVLSDSPSGAHRCMVDWDGKTVRLSSKTYVPQCGDFISFTAKIYELGEDNPDLKRYYRSTGTYIGAVTYEKITPVTGQEERATFLAQEKLRESIDTLRTYLTDGVFLALPEEVAGVLNGMLLGDKTGMGETQQEWFRKAGILHLFAVSGFHTSLWAMLVYRSCLRAGMPKRGALFLSMAFVLFFMALTGFSKSGIRAGLMLLLFFLGKWMKRPVDSLNSLGFAALVLCLGNPFAGGDTGLLLSYFATLGILSIYPILRKKLLAEQKKTVAEQEQPFAEQEKPIVRQKKQNIPFWKRAALLLALSASTFVFTLPISMLSFGAVSLVSPLSNLLVTGLSSVAILFGGMGAVFHGIPLLKLFSPWCFLIAGGIVKGITLLCRKIAALPFCYMGIDSPSLQLAVAGTLVLTAVSLVLFYSVPKERRVSALAKGSLPRLTCLLCCILLLGAALSYDLLK